MEPPHIPKHFPLRSFQRCKGNDTFTRLPNGKKVVLCKTWFNYVGFILEAQLQDVYRTKIHPVSNPRRKIFPRRLFQCRSRSLCNYQKLPPIWHFSTEFLNITSLNYEQRLPDLLPITISRFHYQSSDEVVWISSPEENFSTWFYRRLTRHRKPFMHQTRNTATSCTPWNVDFPT